MNRLPPRKNDVLCGHLDRESLTECLIGNRIYSPTDFQLDTYCMSLSHKRCPYYPGTGLDSTRIQTLLMGHTAFV